GAGVALRERATSSKKGASIGGLVVTATAEQEMVDEIIAARTRWRWTSGVEGRVTRKHVRSAAAGVSRGLTPAVRVRRRRVVIIIPAREKTCSSGAQKANNDREPSHVSHGPLVARISISVNGNVQRNTSSYVRFRMIEVVL